MAYPTISGGSYGINENNINETPSGTVNGSNAEFTLANTPVSGSEQVYRDGQLMKGGGDDYSISGTTITFTTAPVTGSVLLATYKQAVNASGNADTLDGQDAPTGTIVGTTDTQTLTNKTLTSPTVNYGDSAPSIDIKSRAYRSTTQSIANSTITTVIFQTENYDIGGDYNTTTGIFTAPVAGYYLISSQIRYDATTNPHLYAGWIALNGGQTIYMTGGYVNGRIGMNASTVLYLSADDTILTKAYQTSGGAVNIEGARQDSYLNVHLLST